MSLVDFSQLRLPPEIAAELSSLSRTIFFTEYSGKGANGETFFGVNVPLMRKVAVKFYYCGVGSRFHAEPQLLAAVRSPNVIEVLDAKVVGDEWALFQMPFCEQGDLDAYLEAGLPSLHSSIDMMIGLLGGIAELHAARLLHRDLKPENLLVTDQGRLVVGDFGSVYRLPDGVDGVPGSGHTILYRPPEAFEGGAYSSRSDLYQAGVILFQVLGGKLPYTADAWIDRTARRCLDGTDDAVERSQCIDVAIERKIRGGRLLDLDSLPPVVPERARRAVRRAVRPEVERRFETCTDFIAALRQIRQTSLDWRCQGDLYCARAGDRDLRVVPHRGGYQVEQRLRGGWRRIGDLYGPAVRPLVAGADQRFNA